MTTEGPDAKHPDWLDRAPEWELMRDAVRGETAIKAKGEAYLPRPGGFTRTQAGSAMYDRYRLRAEFPEITGPTIRGMVGVIHRKEAQVEMPPAMEPLWERATADGLPLEALHRRITSEVLTTGRYGLLADASAAGSDTPFLAGYSAESLINWSDARDFYALDEGGKVRDGFSWKHEKRVRVLELINGAYVQRVYSGAELAEAEDVIPTGRGAVPLAAIPFVVIGPRDLSVPPQDPPILGVGRAALASYQLAADYRWQLFMTGQETLFVINGDAPETVGAGVVVTLRGSEGVVPDAKYVGPAGTGIEAHRLAIQDKGDDAVAAGARMFEAGGSSQESGEARKIRYAAQTATLTSIAQTSAQGLEAGLRNVATMMGLDPSKVTVTPDLSFLEGGLSAQEIDALVKTWQAGAISYGTLHENLRRGEIIGNEISADDELAAIEAEDADHDDRELVAAMTAGA